MIDQSAAQECDCNFSDEVGRYYCAEIGDRSHIGKCHYDKSAAQPGTPETKACMTPIEDLCKAALNHYEVISTKAHEWYNQIPLAIKFWYLEKPKLESALREAEARADNEKLAHDATLCRLATVEAENAKHRATIVAAWKWLEANAAHVFKEGIWDAIGEAQSALTTSSEPRKEGKS